MSERSSHMRFWNSKRKNDTDTQSRGKLGTAMKEAKVFTTASRTLGIVCRKNGKRVGASVESGSLATFESHDEVKQNERAYETVSLARILMTLSYATNFPVDMN